MDSKLQIKPQDLTLNTETGQITQFNKPSQKYMDGTGKDLENEPLTIKQSTPWLMKCTSVLNTAVCIGLLIYFCYGVFVEFLGDPISMETTFQEETNHNLVFPDVIICLHESQGRNDNITLSVAIEDVASKMEQSLRTNQSRKSTKDSNYSALQEHYRKILWSPSTAQNTQSSANENSNASEKQKFIIDCQARKSSTQNDVADCIPYFEEFIANDFSNCKKLNLPVDLRYSMSLVRGRIGGLKINLFLNKTNDATSFKDGVKVVLSDRRFQVTPEEHGININPGTDESIDFTREESIKLRRNGPEKHQQFQCMTERNWSMFSPNSDEITGLDTFTHKTICCEQACESIFKKKMCGCVASLYYGKTVCLPTEEQSKCLEANESNLASHIRECVDDMCQPLCKTVNYQVNLGETTFPSDSFMPVFLATIISNVSRIDPKIKQSVQNLVNQFGSSSDFSKLRKYFIHLHVYSETYATTHNNEVIVYTTWSLISNIGGNMGLFLGWSLAGVYQILVQLCSQLKKKMFCKKKRP